MRTCIIALLALVSGATVAEELCAGYTRSIEPDMQIQESDLNSARALEAAIWLERHLDNVNNDQEMRWGRLNRLKILRGYALRQKALEEKQAFGDSSNKSQVATEAFCTWLVKDGFWYD